MIAIDTNVLVRALTNDNDSPEQTQLAQEFITSADKVFIPQIVQVEFVWVLERAYNVDKADIISALEMLFTSSKYQLQHEDIFIQAIERFKISNAGFADSLIATESQQIGCKLWTFDRKLSHQDNVCRLV